MLIPTSQTWIDTSPNPGRSETNTFGAVLVYGPLTRSQNDAAA